MGSENDQAIPLTRWYIDTRELTSATSSLPLLETLQTSDQETVKKYYQLADRHMSLASYLLKYLYIHRTCRIPWPEICISRTPAPHHRPCYIPSLALSNNPPRTIPDIEFNVSHQASLVALAGTIIPPSEDPTSNTRFIAPIPSSTPHPSTPQVGIDITCVDERRRGGKSTSPTTTKDLADFVDIFAEVFSAGEIDTMKSLPSRDGEYTSEAEAVKAGLRLFYTYWALKEAYIKMTGEALLASWLRELEFTDVVAPVPTPGSAWSSPYSGVRTWLYGKEVKDVRIEVVAFEQDYIIATAARGGEIGSGSGSNGHDPWRLLKQIDIERDVALCATESCRCLEQ